MSTVLFTDKEEILRERLEYYGPDILREEFTLPLFKRLVHDNNKRNIVQFLLDQSVVSGCGNYIKDEVLYHSGIAPSRSIETLTDRDIEIVYESLRIIPRIAYNLGVSHGPVDRKEKKYGRPLKIHRRQWAKQLEMPDGVISWWDPATQT